MKFEVRYAKRCMAAAALREAMRLIDETKPRGEFGSYSADEWKKAAALARQAAEQLRQSEGER